MNKNCKEFYILFGFLWCEVLCEFVEVVEKFLCKEFLQKIAKKMRKKFRENVGRNLIRFYQAKS